MNQANFYASVYGIIANADGKILVAKRGEKAQGFVGRYQFPAGHIDGKETVFGALKREIHEELKVNIQEQDVDLVHTVHRTFEDGREYFDFYFKIKKFSGNISIGEPEQCSEIRYVGVDEFEDIKLLRHDHLAFNNAKKGVLFSELILKDIEY